MTTLKQLKELAVAQENGATIEAYGELTCEWHPIGKLDELDLDLLGDIRIKQPAIDRTDLEWCGYGVPDKNNCDWYISINKYPLEIKKAAAIGMDWNNGYRHLYRYKQPNVLPYTFDTFELKSSHLKTKEHGALLPIGIVFTDGFKCVDKDYTFKYALEKVTWPDGSPFGVELAG